MKTDLDFPSGDRTYYVSDERLLSFRQLATEQKLRWLEEIAMFLRMARYNREEQRKIPK